MTKTLDRVMMKGTESVQGTVIAFPETTTLEGHSVMTGDEFDAEIRRLGFTQVGFGEFVGIAPRTIRTYVQKGPPAFIVKMLSLMSSQHVEGGWRGNRLKPAPTLDETREAVEPAVQALVSRAVEQHWDAATVADALCAIADDIRSASTTSERKAVSA